MDISKETDQTKLKALAYEQMLAIQQSQQNLSILQSRIAELSEVAKKTDK